MQVGLSLQELDNKALYQPLLQQSANFKLVDVNTLSDAELEKLTIFSLEAYLALEGVRAQPALVLAPTSTDLQTLKLTIQAWRKGAVGVWFLDDLPQNIKEKIANLLNFIEQQQVIKQIQPLASLQQQLQPKSRFISPHFKVKAQLIPAAQMCGDWIEYWQVNEHTLLFFLADVAGHGLISSFLTPWLAASRNRFDYLPDLLNELNKELCKLDVAQHVAMLAGRIDAKLNTLQWCNAGHYPPGILALPHQPLQLLTGDSLALGLDPNMQTTIHQMHLPENAQVIFASDGVVELYKGSLEERVNEFLQHFEAGTFAVPTALADDIGILNVRINQ